VIEVVIETGGAAIIDVDVAFWPLGIVTVVNTASEFPASTPSPVPSVPSVILSFRPRKCTSPSGETFDLSRTESSGSVKPETILEVRSTKQKAATRYDDGGAIVTLALALNPFGAGPTYTTPRS
jgi:hypothetical protein